MDDDVIADLKQFIAATVSQQLELFSGEIRGEIRQLDEKLTAKIDDLSSSVGEAINTTNESADSKLEDHEKRIKKLEQKTA